MAREPIQIQTTLPLDDAARIFQMAMRGTWFSENITGQGTEFLTPPPDAFDGARSDPPTFAVMAVFGRTNLEAAASAVHMYAWDRGAHRDIQLGIGRAIASFGIKANMKIRKFVTALKEADPSTRATGI